MNINYLNECLHYAELASVTDDVPVGAVIVDLITNSIIGYGYNCKEEKQNCLCHAEIMAINMACKNKNSKNLDFCAIYSTLEPCLMCLGAINEARIKTLYFGAKNCENKFLIEQMFMGKTVVNMQNKECSKILKVFFKKKRKDLKSVI